MKLKSIEISNYKSIKTPIKIDLTGGKPTVFTGKNGCGKTNLLEAINIALSERGYEFDGAKDIIVKRTYQLDKSELKEYFAITEKDSADNNLDEIEVTFDRNEPDIRWAKVPAIEFSVEKFRPRLEKVKAEFEVSTKNYLEIINGFLDEIGYDGFLYFSFDDNREGYYNGKRRFSEHLLEAEAGFKSTVEDIDELLNYLSAGAIKIDDTSDGRYFNNRRFYVRLNLPQITAYKFTADKMTAHCLGITEETISKANAECEKIINSLNARLKSEHEKITAQLEEIKKIANEVKSLSHKYDERFYDDEAELEKRKAIFYEKLKSAMHRKCYFLDNENSMLFFDSRDMRFESAYKRERNLNSYNPIMDAFDNFLKVGNHYKEGENIKQFSKLPDARKAKLVKILNEMFFAKSKLKFDKGIAYKLEMEGGSPELFVIEKNGEKTSFNKTSLGRRWYLTYVFVKRLLKEGDCLLIDEPAAFLHPQAQEEYRKEIARLSKKGITVFYTTHSPNMVSFELDIYGVEMGKKGTQVVKLDLEDKSIKANLEEVGGAFGYNKELVFRLSDTIILVEGVSDKICIEKFAELLNYNLSKYYVHVCDGDAILQCFYLLHKSGIKVLMIADNDNKFKSESYRQQHPNYETVIEYIEATSGLCYFMGDGEKGSLEDLFEDPEHKLPIYYTIEGKTKLAYKTIDKLTGLDGYEKAAENFNKIFEFFKIPKIKVKK